MAQDLAAAGGAAEQGELAVAGRDGEGDDDVVETIGHVGEVSVTVQERCRSRP